MIKRKAEDFCLVTAAALCFSRIIIFSQIMSADCHRLPALLNDRSGIVDKDRLQHMSRLLSINNSFSFLPEHTFFIFCETPKSRTLFKSRACCGQTETQRIQEMHFSLSTEDGLPAGIAPTGHFFAHRPHFVHDLSPSGLNGTPLYSR